MLPHLKNTSLACASVLDVTREPFGADPSGARDSTQAIVAALDGVLRRTEEGIASTLADLEALGVENGLLGESCENRRKNGKSICVFPQVRPFAPTLYFPAGEYVVSDTIVHSLTELANSFGSEMCWQIRFRGDGLWRSTIRLRDAAPGFSGPHPKPVVQFLRRGKSNVAMSNYFEDLSICTGRNNGAAVGLDFFANNSGAVRNVRIYSDDGKGFAGLLLGHGNYSGILIKNVHTRGFDFGCHFSSTTRTMFFAAEGLKIRQARRAGIYVGGISASLRAVDCQAGVPALLCEDSAGHTVLVDSRLEGPEHAAALDYRGGALFADAVEVVGFGSVLAGDRRTPQPDSGNGAGHRVRELVLPRRCDSHEVSPVARLPVEETPVWAPGEGNTTTGVRRFGARGDGVADDTQAIQDALLSGATEIAFEPGRYRVCRPVRIPAGVQRVCFNFCDLVAGFPLAGLAGQGAFRIEGMSAHPLFIEDIFAWEQWRGDHVMFDHASRRTLVLSDLHTQTLPMYRNSVPGGRVFIENVATTAGVVPGRRGHGRTCFHFTGQEVWARQINPERGEPMVLNDGGSLWILGFKSEDSGATVETVNGGKTEILGGVANGGDPDAVAFVVRDAEMRLSAVSNGWEPARFFGTILSEVGRGGAHVLSNAECLSRGLPPERGPQICVSLYSTPRRVPRGEMVTQRPLSVTH